MEFVPGEILGLIVAFIGDEDLLNFASCCSTFLGAVKATKPSRAFQLLKHNFAFLNVVIGRIRSKGGQVKEVEEVEAEKIYEISCPPELKTEERVILEMVNYEGLMEFLSSLRYHDIGVDLLFICGPEQAFFDAAILMLCRDKEHIDVTISNDNPEFDGGYDSFCHYSSFEWTEPGYNCKWLQHALQAKKMTLPVSSVGIRWSTVEQRDLSGPDMPYIQAERLNYFFRNTEGYYLATASKEKFDRHLG